MQAHAQARVVAERYPAATNVAALPGQGVSGAVDGRAVLIGSHAHFENAIPHANACADLTQAAAQGQTPLLLSLDGDYVGYILVADSVRPESAAALVALRALGVQQMIMLTGDAPSAAQHIADAVALPGSALDAVQAGLLPAQKVAAIEALKAQGRTVAMVGDGVNDAPALASAQVGIAMGAGTAQAIETADIVLMGDNLQRLPEVLRIAHAALGTVRFNIFFSVAIKLVFFALVLAGLSTMWMAVLADVGASLLVTLNGMRLLRMRVDV